MSLLSHVSPAAAWVAVEGGSSTDASWLTAATAVPLTPAPTRAEAGLPRRGSTRELAQDHDSVQLQIPPNLTAEELRGGYGFALALSIFSGLLMTATLVLLFGLWARERWFDEAAPSRGPSPSRRSSASQR